MATTSIGSDRQTGSALEKYTDAVFIRDDKKLYFGTGGDGALLYDSNSDCIMVSDLSIHVEDDFSLKFGTNGDVALTYDSTSDCLLVTGGDIHIDDAQSLKFGTNGDVHIKYDATSDTITLKGLPTSDPGISDGLYLTNGSDLTLSTG